MKKSHFRTSDIKTEKSKTQPSYFRTKEIIEKYKITAKTAINSLEYFEDKIGKEIDLDNAGKKERYRCVEFEMEQPVNNKHIQCIYVLKSKDGNPDKRISSKILAGKNNYKIHSGFTWIL